MKTIRNTRSGLTLSIVLIGVLCVLLPTLAYLQYRWIGQVSESERERLEEGLDTARRRFEEEIFRMFSGLASNYWFQPTPEGSNLESQLARSLEQWETTAPYPEIARSAYVSEIDPGGELALFWFNPEFERLEHTEWPASLNSLKARIGELTNVQWPDPVGTRFDIRPAAPRDQAATPNDTDSIWVLIPRLRAPEFRQTTRRPPLEGWIMFEIDTTVIASELLPTLVATHFDARDYKVAVFESDESDRVVFRSEETLSRKDLTAPDLVFSALAPDPRLRRGMATSTPPPRRPRQIAGRRFTDFPPPVRREGGRPRGPQAVPFMIFGPRWQLVAQHQTGSLERAVSTLRQRNLFVGLGILTLLGVSGVMTIVWAERVRSIGRLQMEFAAGISHELRTPLTTIRTAAHNIESGVVNKPEEVREYAEIVKNEGRRLSQMVDQTILFAQTEAGRRHYELHPVDVSRVVDRTLGVTFPSAEEARSKIRIEIERNLPRVLADETALTHSLGNLIANALKYGSGDGAIVIEARVCTRTNQVRLGVSNSGAAIDPADIQHIFEPFYRGRNIGRSAGSGLGLSLVRKMIEGQNGKVTVSSEPGTTKFTLHLPASPAIEHTVSVGATP